MGGVFLLGAGLMLRGGAARRREPRHREVKSPSFPRVAGSSFRVILVAEFGDLTQLVTANLAAEYLGPLTSGSGRSLGCGWWRPRDRRRRGLLMVYRSPWSSGSPPPSWRCWP